MASIDDLKIYAKTGILCNRKMETLTASMLEALNNIIKLMEAIESDDDMSDILSVGIKRHREDDDIKYIKKKKM